MKKTILLVLVCLFVVAGLSAARTRAYTQQVAALGSELPNQQFPDVTATSTQTQAGYVVNAWITTRPTEVTSTLTHVPGVIRLYRFGNGTTMPYSTRIFLQFANWATDWTGGETIHVQVINNNVVPAKEDSYEIVIPNNLTSALTVTDPIPVFDLWPAVATDDYVAGDPVVVAPGITFTLNGGNGNSAAAVVPPAIMVGINVESVIYEEVVELLGAGPWTLTYETAAIEGAWYSYVTGTWTTVPNVGGFVTFIIPAGGKDIPEVPIILGDDTLPVTLSSFAATLTAQNFVKLTWVTETETSLSGYYVLRSETADLANAVKVSQLIDATNTSSTQTYSHIDNEVAPETTYYYWLESVEMNGSSVYHGPTNVYVEAGQPVTPSLISTMGNAYPNPFKANSNTNIAYEVKAGETGTITIYNIIGQVVKTVPVSETTTPRTFTWNGRDSKGNVCGSGIYFYKLSTPSRNITKKMVIVN